MTTVIEIGPVPSKECPPQGDINVTIANGVFMRQLNRQKPLPEGARYVAMQRFKAKPWLSVVLTTTVNTWESADVSMELASAALEIQHWDDEALQELQQHGLAPRSPKTAIAA